MIEADLREPSPVEQGVMRRLLTADFAGKEALARQLDRCRVRIIDTEGTLLLEPSRDADPAVVLKRIPVEAEATDEDGIRIHFLLHVVGGFIRELEVYKDDGSRIKRMPRPDELAVIVLPR